MKIPTSQQPPLQKVEVVDGPKSVLVKPRPGARSYADYLLAKIFRQFGKVDDVWTSKDGKSFLIDFRAAEAVEAVMKPSSTEFQS
eukprot:CAMPEP_0170500470 /NCGR_PEP_ID=MMETSP0208-20121228/34958_1 /TAXON_ID=197538 /ORGANISM="Strombidium inclinatum, Strain S3" /LENGTH=84 /DNA_ID=CAMNT_0010778531 /DNA_START=536 /DNA_END=790 /DNA_ORIENTATION=+